ncbi:MAG: hypothetical protein JWM95_4980 [Gemmatimonadetes bacterium]|nr:hypothetical protein [Gemmatimonadota bacterium]
MAFVLVLVVTELPGPGLDPDALAYLGSAESIALHGSYRIPVAQWASADSTEPLAHFPPAYSTVLAVPVKLGMPPTQAARLVEALAAFVTVTMLAFLVASAASLTAAALCVAALFVMTSMHEVHVSVLSEPLYLACTALVLASMALAPSRPWRAGIPAAVGLMTRYVGASLVGAVALWALIQPGPWPVRIRRAAIACTPALLLEIAWILRTRAAQGAEEIRTFAIYGNLGATLEQGAKTVSAWLIPDAAFDRTTIPHRGLFAIALAMSLVALVGSGALRALRASWNPADVRAAVAKRLMSAMTLLVVCYLAVVGASRLFADPDIPLDRRILAPVFLLLAMLTSVGMWYWWRGTRLMVARVAVSVAFITWWIASAGVVREEARFILTFGSDLAGVQWRQSEVLSWTRTEGSDAMLWTNWPAAVYFHLHRPAHELPKNREMTPTTLAAFADTVRARDGRVILFNVQTGEYPANAVLSKLPGLRVVEVLRDGLVLGPATP